MNMKTTLVLAVAALVIGGYLLLVESGTDDTPPAPKLKTIAKDLFDPKPDDVDRLEVESKYGGHVAFAKKDDVWVMTEPVECPAQDYQVTSVLDKVKDAQYMKAYDKGDEGSPSGDITGLDEPLATVALFSGETKQAELVVGKRVGPGGKGNYVRRGGSETIYVSKDDLNNAFTKKAPEYRNKKLLDTKFEDVTRVQVEGSANFVLVKDDDQWVIESPAKGRADKTKADGVARKFCNLSVKDWVADKPASYKIYQLDEPRLKVTLNTEKEIPPKAQPGDPDAKPADTQPSVEKHTHVLLVGGPTDSKGDAFFARLASAPWVFSINDSDRKELATSLADLRDKALAVIDQPKVNKVQVDTDAGTMTVTKTQNKWQFADDTPADATSVTDLLKSVEDLEASEFADPGTLLTQLDWKKPRSRVTISQEGQLNPVTILVGPKSSSGKMVYVKNAASDAVAVVREDDVTQLLLSAVSYRDRTVLEFPRDRANRLEINRAGSDAVALTKENNQWKLTSPIEADADAGAARNLLLDLSSLRARRAVAIGDKAKYGLDKPDVSLAVYVAPLTADPKTKVTGTRPATATQPTATQPTASTSGQPSAAATQPATAPAKTPAYTVEELLEYTKSLPKTATRPGDITQNPIAIAAMQKMIAARKAEEQGSKILRLAMTKHDGVVYACREGDEIIYELEDKHYDDAMAEMHDRSVAKFTVADVAEVAFQAAGDEVTLRKSAPDKWQARQDPVLPIDGQKVTEALNDFRDLQTHRYVAYDAPSLADYKLDADVDRLAVTLDDGTKIEILLSKVGPADDPDESRYAGVAGSTKVFLLEGEQAAKFAKTLDDFEKNGKTADVGSPSGGAPVPAYAPRQ